jgi:hypothetical protein
MILENTMLSTRSKSHIVQLHLHGNSKQENSQNQQVDQWLLRDGMGMTAHGCRVSLLSDENVIKLAVAMAVPHWMYTKNH